MEKHLITVLVLTGVVHLALTATHKYFLIQQSMTWLDAQTYCQTNHQELANIKTDDDLARIQAEATSQGFTSSAWVGIYIDMNSWRWSMGNETLGTMRSWYTASYQPNNRDGHQECASISEFGWFDETCTDLFGFICFDARNTGSDCYIYYPDLKTWFEAQSYCRQYHTDLASSRDPAEEAIIQSKIPDYTFFGLFRDSWKWTDGTIISNSFWQPTQPDNYNGDEYCVYFDQWQAVDTSCSDLMPFYCYSVWAKKLVLKVKVQSNQNMNDPGVFAALLEKIYQKLKVHGLDVAVKWKEAGGVTFTKIIATF